MKQITTKSGDILCVEVLPEHFDFKISGTNYICAKPDMYVYEQLEGNCKILGKLSELTDKDCEEFVENTVRCNNCDWEDCEDNLKTFVDMSEHVGKEIYYYKGCPNCETDDYLMDIAKESFISLLKSEGIDTSNEDKLLIIKLL